MSATALVHAPDATRHTAEFFYLPPAAAAQATPRTDSGALIDLFGLSIADATLEEAARWLVHQATIGRRLNTAFINAHCVNVSYHNAAYRTVLAAMDVLFADGAGLRIAAKITGQRFSDNVNGTDLFPLLCAEAAAAGVSVYMLGGGQGVAGQAAKAMCGGTPGLGIAGTQSGFFKDPAEEADAIDAINRSGARILLVGMGVPLQEQWIARNRYRIKTPVIIGVGGLFDYYSGRIPRAPLPLRRLGLEWTWRLAMEPKRLARRYLLGNIEFLARLAAFRTLAPTALSAARAR